MRGWKGGESEETPQGRGDGSLPRYGQGDEEAHETLDSRDTLRGAAMDEVALEVRTSSGAEGARSPVPPDGAVLESWAWDEARAEQSRTQDLTSLGSSAIVVSVVGNGPGRGTERRQR